MRVFTCHSFSKYAVIFVWYSPEVAALDACSICVGAVLSGCKGGGGVTIITIGWHKFKWKKGSTRDCRVLAALACSTLV